MFSIRSLLSAVAMALFAALAAAGAVRTAVIAPEGVKRQAMPARAIMWSTSNVFPSKSGYVTQTFDPAALVDRLRPALEESEDNLLAIFISVEGHLDLSQAEQLKRYSTRNGAYSEIAPYVYAAADSDETVLSLVRALPALQSATSMDLPALATAASEDKLPKTGALLVEAGATPSEELDIVVGVVMSALQRRGGRYVAAVVEEPEAALPALEGLFAPAAPLAGASGSGRRLSSSNVTTNGTSPEEGDEWSIYYNGTYLYITPDIAAGLLLGLLFVFVVTCGLGCLDSVTSTDVYAKKYPAIGKEY